MEKKYTPISCVYYDLIEHYAIRREIIEIVISTDEGLKTFKSRILDTKIKDKVEYILLETPELIIRMDHIISLNGEALADFQKC